MSHTKESSSSKQPRVVVVTRPTEYELLLLRHATMQQARFFLESRGQSLEEERDRHRHFEDVLQAVLRAIPGTWRRTRVDRADLDRFLFEPEDVVVALGQDGLVANASKYLRGQTVIGLNPEPERYEGLLVPHPPEAALDLMVAAAEGRARHQERAMVEAILDDGQSLVALNEVFIGHHSHQSARYRIAWGERREAHSSSGVIVATGTGSTGWARSIRRQRRCDLPLPEPEDRSLAFFVREAWPSIATGTDLTEGLIGEGETLELVSEMNEGGVVFGDGIEADHLPFSWGRRLEIRLSSHRLRLMDGGGL